MNLLALKGEVSCKRCIVYEVRSIRKLFNCGVYYHFVLILPILTALKGGVLDPTANKERPSGDYFGWSFLFSINHQTNKAGLGLS
jgi:hypothetical protein